MSQNFELPSSQDPASDFVEWFEFAADNVRKKPSPDKNIRAGMASQLFLQTFCAADSINTLLKAKPKVCAENYAINQTAYFVLARSIFESYLTMFYLALEPVSNCLSQQQLELRLLWWEWHFLKEKHSLAKYHPGFNPNPNDDQCRDIVLLRQSCVTGKMVFR